MTYRIYKFCACKRFWLVYFDYFIYLCQQKVQEEMGGSGSGSGGGGGSSDSDSTPTLTMEQTPLTFEAAEAGAKVTFTVKVATDPVEYSTDGKTWSPYTSDEAIELAAVGDKVSFRGTNAAYADDAQNSSITCDKNCYIYGNIMSLIKKEDFENVTTFTADYTFRRLFMGNTKIKNHTDATKYLVLPATKMTAYCYFDMFSGCSQLASVPSNLLPSENLASFCYQVMFNDCITLTKAPKLPAASVYQIEKCYNQMFQGCTNLNEAWVKADYKNTFGLFECYNMFDGVTAANNATSKFYTDGNWDDWKGAFANINAWTKDNYTPAP